MAEVWRAVETDDRRRVVAIKRLLPTVAEHSELVSMFIAEANVMLALKHPNIVRVYELGEVARTYFISMEYVHGQDLRRILEVCRESSQPPPIPIACHVISEVCKALDYVHRFLDESGREINLVHRDVSPSNVLVSYSGDVKLIDFGIAQAGVRSPDDSSEVNGKAAYMSPEQVLGLAIDRRSDIFSVGVCLHELLTGKRLFAGACYPALAPGVGFPIPPPSQRNPSIPSALEGIVLKALASDPENRYQYASELAADLQRFLAESSHFEAKDLVKHMESTFADENVQEQPPEPQLPDDISPPPLSLLPKVVAAGQLLSNAISEGQGSIGMNIAADRDKVEHGAVGAVGSAPSDSVAIQHSGSNGSEVASRDGRSDPNGSLGADSTEPSARRMPSPRIRVSDAVLAFSETARESKQLTRPSEADAGDAPLTSSLAMSKGKALAWGMLGAALVLAVAFLAVLVAQKTDSGYLSIDLPRELKGKNVSVAFRAEPLQVPKEGKLLHKAKAGSGVLVIQADGYQPLAQTVVLKGAHEVTEVPAKLTPIVRSGQLAVAADPEDAEVSVNGIVVASGAAGPAFYLGEIPVGSERLVQVRRAGYKSFESRVKASKPGEQVKIHAKLLPLDYSVRVQSAPLGATVWANGARLGRTPMEVHLSEITTELSLTKRCYQTAQVPVSAKTDAGPINISLKRLASCP